MPDDGSNFSFKDGATKNDEKSDGAVIKPVEREGAYHSVSMHWLKRSLQTRAPQRYC
jgi:hypothetical protein